MSTTATKHAAKPDVHQVILTKPIDIVGEKRVFVVPATVHLRGEHPPKSIQWINQTGGPVTIWLPNADRYLQPYEDPETHAVHEFITPFDVAPKGELLVDVKEKYADGRYVYNVYCEITKDYAQGNSAPDVSCP